MVERQEGDGGPDADSPGALRDDRHRHEGIRQERERPAEVQLGEPGDIEAERVGELDELEHLRVALGVRASARLRRLEEEPESHRVPGYSQSRQPRYGLACGCLVPAPGSDWPGSGPNRDLPPSSRSAINGTTHPHYQQGP